MLRYRGRYRRCDHCGQPLPIKKPPKVETPYRRYRQHLDNAKGRGVEFRLTFDQWWGIWKKSKRWKQRGRRLGQYVMARHGDKGPYAVGNVSIVLVSDNCAKNKV